MSRHHNMSGKDKRAKMRQLHSLQDGLCAFCGLGVVHPDAPGRPHPEAFMAPSLEHVVPRSRQGTNRIENLLLAHRGCNADRATDPLPPPAERMWRQVLARLDAQQPEAAA
jgi:5-methylcytosine-specific restriction endonuclease McrA